MFYDEFVRLCNEKKISRTKACVDCGISRTAWHKWENGATPNGVTISKFADYFGVSTSQLLEQSGFKTIELFGNMGGMSKIKNFPDEPLLTEEEIELVDLFRLIPEEGQRMILQMVRAYADSLK